MHKRKDDTMKNKLKKTANILIKLYALYVFMISAMIAMAIGIARPVLGIGGIVMAAFVLIALSCVGGADDSDRDEDGA